MGPALKVRLGQSNDSGHHPPPGLWAAGCMPSLDGSVSSRAALFEQPVAVRCESPALSSPGMNLAAHWAFGIRHPYFPSLFGRGPSELFIKLAPTPNAHISLDLVSTRSADMDEDVAPFREV